MWCPHCQSDVPQTAGSAIGARRCCRCGRSPDAGSRRFGSDEGLDLGNAPGAGTAYTSPSTWDDWTLAAEVQRARQLLTAADSTLSADWRIDARHLLSLDSPDPADRRRRAVTRPRSIRRKAPGGAFLALAVGLVTFGCGVVAAVFRLDGVPTVTHLGVPLMLVGLFCLAVGVLLQLHRIRRESRAALDRMRLLDLRLQEYRQTALLVGPAAQIRSGRDWHGHAPFGSRFASGVATY